MSEDKKNAEQKPSAPDWLIENIAEASKNTRKAFLVYIGFLAYCTLTILGTTDRQLILNQGAHLPVVNVNISLNGFFFFAPIIGTFLFFYLQLYLTRLNALIMDLRSTYDDPGKRRLYPWIVTIAEEPEPGAVGVLQRLVMMLSIYWSLPIVLTLFAFWYIKKHDPILSYSLAFLDMFGTIVVLWFWFHYKPPRQQKLILDIFLRAGLGVVIFLMVIFLSLVAIPWSKTKLSHSSSGLERVLWNWFCVDLSYQKLITEPQVDYGGIYWSDLGGVDLRGGNLYSCILKRADLRQAKLQKVALGFSTLEKANLLEANLEYSSLSFASFKEANLNHSILRNSKGNAIDFTKAYFIKADLSNVEFIESDFRESWIQEANLSGAYLRGCNFQKVFLAGSNLSNAYLGGTSFSGATLYNVNFQGADLRFAILTGVQDLTIEQLSKAKCLYQTTMDSSFHREIEKNYPNLLRSIPDSLTLMIQ